MVRDMPKIELHRHLEGGIRPTTAWKLAQIQNINLGFADYPSFEKAALEDPSLGINSDDPGLFGSTLSEEYELLERTFKISAQDFRTINLKALQSSFLPEERQAMVRERYFLQV